MSADLIPAALSVPGAANAIASIETMRSFAVVNAETYTTASDARTAIKSLEKRVEEARKRAVGPLNDRVKLINEAARRILAAPHEVDELLQRRMIEWRRAEDRRREEEQRRIAEENERRRREAEAREREEMEARARVAEEMELDDAETAALVEATPEVKPILEVAPAALPQTTHGSLGSSTLVTRWDFRVIAEYDVPREYLSVDERKIRAAIKTGVREIPGVSIYSVDALVRR